MKCLSLLVSEIQSGQNDLLKSQNRQHFKTGSGIIKTKNCILYFYQKLTEVKSIDWSVFVNIFVQIGKKFVCVEFIVPLENFSLIWRRHHCRWRAASFDLWSALMVIEQWGFLLTCHTYCDTGLPFYNGHLRGSVTLTPVAERLAVELSLPDFTTQVCRDRRSNPDLPHARRTIYLYATGKK